MAKCKARVSDNCDCDEEFESNEHTDQYCQKHFNERIRVKMDNAFKALFEVENEYLPNSSKRQQLYAKRVQYGDTCNIVLPKRGY